jgi:hypothetical protein
LASNPVGWAVAGLVVFGIVMIGLVSMINSSQTSRSKPVNLPKYKRLRLDKEEIMSGHSSGGNRGGPDKDRFPDWMTWPMIQKAIEEAYNTSKKLVTTGERVFLKGVSETYRISVEMWVNIKTKVIETAWPK